MHRFVRRTALLGLGTLAALATMALAPANPVGWQVSDHAVLAEQTAGRTTEFLSSHYGLAAEALSADPMVVAGWWNTLTPTQRDRLGIRMPEVVGNLAGVDFAARDRANRIQLERDLADAAEALAAHPSNEQAAQRLMALQAIQGALATPGDGGRYLVQLTADAPPLASIAIGDLDAADQVTFAVPGMGTFTTDMQLWTRAAQNLYDAQSEGSVRRAVIAWVGYVTPPVGLEATRDDYAARGAVLLERDIAGVRAARPDQPSISVVAHSYGATTAARALAAVDLDVRTFVMLGSAGVDTAITDADALHVDRVYAGEADADTQARWGRVERRDPTEPAFGATPLGVEGNEARGLLGVTGHAPIIHSPWNDDPASPVWLRYADADARERQFERHMSSFGYLDAGTQSLANTATVTTAPLERARITGPELRAKADSPADDERGPAAAEPLSELWIG